MVLEQTIARIKLGRRLGVGVLSTASLELKEGQLLRTLNATRRRRSLAFASDWTFAQLLHWAAYRYGDRPWIRFGGTTLTFAQLNARASRLAQGLYELGLRSGDGVALMMENHPCMLEVFFAVQKLHGYAVPVNAALVGDGLVHVLNHAQVKACIVDHERAASVSAVRQRLSTVEHYYAHHDEVTKATADGFGDLGSLYDAPPRITSPVVAADAPCLLLYTSGTTGLPKAVAYQHGNTGLKRIGLSARVLYDRTDVIYSCLPLFHANALLVSTMQSLWLGIPLVLSRRFSASRFWQEIAESGATSFNTLGAMIPILLKQPVSPYESQHRVRRVLSSACPTNAWKPFEARFGAKLWEVYGAVDGGGFVVLNAGNAPAGSLGKPLGGTTYRIVNDDCEDAPVGEPGELIFRLTKDQGREVEYFRDARATANKLRGGWLRTGDLVSRDAQGFLYFVGRKTDSMRRRGENVSAFEVERQVEAHPDVLESAVFGVPSELGEEEIDRSPRLAGVPSRTPAQVRRAPLRRDPRRATAHRHPPRAEECAQASRDQRRHRRSAPR